MSNFKTRPAHTALIVRSSGAVQVPVADLVATAQSLGFPMTLASYQPNHQVMQEMIGQPKFKGLVGPMYGGEGIVRYEDGETYELLSR